MRALAVLRRTLPVLLLLPLVACYDDDDDGPTGPPGPVARIAGVWSGELVPDNAPGTSSVVIFDLVQQGREVSGVVSVGSVAWSLRGEVDSRDIFRWRTGDGTCGSFDGSAEVETDTHMEGRVELDRFFCSERERIRGDVFLDLERRR